MIFGVLIISQQSESSGALPDFDSESGFSMDSRDQPLR
jgi:hypothetical protein